MKTWILAGALAGVCAPAAAEEPPALGAPEIVRQLYSMSMAAPAEFDGTLAELLHGAEPHELWKAVAPCLMTLAGTAPDTGLPWAADMSRTLRDGVAWSDTESARAVASPARSSGTVPVCD